MKKRTCKLLSALLCCAMLLTLLPATALAEGTAGETMRFCAGVLENSGGIKYAVYARYNNTVYVMGQPTENGWKAVAATEQYNQGVKFEAPKSRITTFTLESGEPQTVKGIYNYQWHVFSFTPFYMKTGDQYLTAQAGGLTLGDESAKTHWLTSWYDHWNVGYWTDDLIHYTTYAADNTRIVLDVSDSANPRFTCATATDATHISCRMAYQICRHENEAGEVALTSVAEVPATCRANGTEAHLTCTACGAKYDPTDTEGYRELTDAELIILSTGTEHSDAGGDGACDLCGKNMPSHAYAPAPAGDLAIENKYLLVTKIGDKLYALAKPASNDTSYYPTPTSVEITPQVDGSVKYDDAYNAGALQITIGGGNEVWGAADVYTLEVTAKGMESGILSSTMGGNFSAEVGIDKYGWRAKVTDNDGTAIITSMYEVNWSEELNNANPYYRAYNTSSGVRFSATYDSTAVDATTSEYKEYPVYLYLMNTSEGEEEEHTTHTWDNGVITTQTTCVDTGVMTYTCTVCGETQTEEIAALGHTYGDWVYAGESQHKHICITCGYTEAAACELTMQYDATHHWQTCSVCGGIVGKAEHDMTAWTQNPQILDSEYRYCRTCGYTETRVKEITDAAALVQGESIVINVSGTADTASTTLTAETVNVLADAVSSDDVPANSVTIELNSTTSVTYDAAAVNAINNAVGSEEENTTVTLVVENNPNLDCGMDAGMTPEQQATIIDAAGAANYGTDDPTIPDANTTPVTVYSITLEVTTGTGETATTTEISDFGDGTTTVTVPYNEPVGEGETVSVVRVETDGTTTEMPSDYNADDQTVTWNTGTHSFYMLTKVASTPTPDPAPTPTPDPGTGAYVPVTNGVTAEKAEHGSVTVSPVNAAAGTTVTVTVAPDKGYTLETLTVTDAGGKEVALTAQGDGKYTFKMPSSKVTVKATFMDDNTMLNFFTDVQADNYFYDAILWAVENGITEGTGDGTTFSPNANCTRGQIVTFLWRAAGCPEPKSSANPFTDVTESAYYYKAMLWAVENGITDGTSTTTFSPDAVCTRDQAVTFLWRSAGKPAANTENPFVDVKEEVWYTDAVLWAVEEKVTDGTGKDTFSPGANCTRGQIVTFLYRWMGK